MQSIACRDSIPCWATCQCTRCFVSSLHLCMQDYLCFSQSHMASTSCGFNDNRCQIQLQHINTVNTSIHWSEYLHVMTHDATPRWLLGSLLVESSHTSPAAAAGWLQSIQQRCAELEVAWPCLKKIWRAKHKRSLYGFKDQVSRVPVF